MTNCCNKSREARKLKNPHLENDGALLLCHPRGPRALLEVGPLPQLFRRRFHRLLNAGPLLRALSRLRQVELMDLLGHFLWERKSGLTDFGKTADLNILAS